MKKNLFIVLMFLLSLTAKGQEVYTVLQIKGSVLKNGVALKVNDKITSTDKVQFGAGAKLLVNSPSKGAIPLPPSQAQYPSEIARTFTDYLPKTNRASGKSNPIFASALDFETYFGKAQFRIYGKETAFELSSNFLALNEKNFPFLRFKHPSETEPVNKKLSFQGQKIFLNQAEIFKISGNDVEQKDCDFEGMFFYEEGKAEFNKVVDCQFIFVDDAALQEHAANLLSLIDKNQIDVQLYNNLYNSLADFAQFKYGAVDKDNLEYWIENTLGIAKPNK